MWKSEGGQEISLLKKKGLEREHEEKQQDLRRKKAKSKKRDSRRKEPPCKQKEKAGITEWPQSISRSTLKTLVLFSPAISEIGKRIKDNELALMRTRENKPRWLVRKTKKPQRDRGE